MTETRFDGLPSRVNGRRAVRIHYSREYGDCKIPRVRFDIACRRDRDALARIEFDHRFMRPEVLREGGLFRK